MNSNSRMKGLSIIGITAFRMRPCAKLIVSSICGVAIFLSACSTSPRNSTMSNFPSSLTPTIASSTTSIPITPSTNSRIPSSTLASVTAPRRLYFLSEPQGIETGNTFQNEIIVGIVNFTSADSSASVTLSIVPGTGTAGATLSGTTSVKVVNGFADFANLSIDKVGNGYKLLATSDGLNSVTSESFDVTFNATAILWKYLKGLANGVAGQEFYTAICNNIYLQGPTFYSGQNWWGAWPQDSCDFELDLFVDQGTSTSLLPPNAIVSKLVTTGPLNGREFVYFGWLISPNGKVSHLNDSASWLEEQLSGSHQ